MLKKILEDAIGEDVSTIGEYSYPLSYNDGINAGKSEMRAKIPNIMQKVIEIIDEVNLNSVKVDIINSLTVDNSQEKDNK